MPIASELRGPVRHGIRSARTIISRRRTTASRRGVPNVGAASRTVDGPQCFAKSSPVASPVGSLPGCVFDNWPFWVGIVFGSFLRARILKFLATVVTILYCSIEGAKRVSVSDRDVFISDFREQDSAPLRDSIIRHGDCFGVW